MATTQEKFLSNSQLFYKNKIYFLIVSIFLLFLRRKYNTNIMIREFWVENFLSIKERQTLNFETKSKEDDWASVDMGNEKRVNKLAVIYGANASGKSNMLLVIQNIFEILFTPHSRKQSVVKTRRPFALCPDKPTRLFVSFYANHIRYDYMVSYIKDYIMDELLE